MNQRQRAVVAGAGALLLFALVQVGALALVEPFEAAGFQQVEDPQDPTNSVLYVLLLLVVTGGLLLAFRHLGKRAIRAFFVAVSALIAWYPLLVFAAPVATALDVSALAVSAPLAALVGVALYVYPEWYVVDAAGALMGAGAAALFGISFGVLPAVVLLGALAVYDAIAVYRTEHMLTLGSNVMEMRVPVLLVFPLTRGYSYLEGSARAEDGEREAFFVGLGDAVMPTIMVASGAFFLDAGTIDVPGLTLTVPALTSMAGTLLGLAVLLRMVFRGRSHAGLPLLNGGAILGYLLGALLVGVGPLEALGITPYL